MAPRDPKLKGSPSPGAPLRAAPSPERAGTPRIPSATGLQTCCAPLVLGSGGCSRAVAPAAAGSGPAGGGSGEWPVPVRSRRSRELAATRGGAGASCLLRPLQLLGPRAPPALRRSNLLRPPHLCLGALYSTVLPAGVGKLNPSGKCLGEQILAPGRPRPVP